MITLRYGGTMGTTDTYREEITNQYGTGATYALGQITQVDSKNYKNNDDSDYKDTRTTTTFAWYDGATVDLIRHDRAVNDADNSIYYSDYSLSASGTLNSVFINDGRDRTVTFLNDMDGKAIERNESDNNSQGDPRTIWYRFGGRELATTANQPAPTQLSYGESVTERTRTEPATYSFTAKPTIDSDLSYDAINSFRQGSAGGRYTVRGGDTLQGIALAVYGDASYWYKLAEANGLSGDAMLVEGQSLNLPSGVTRSKNNASTFKPYDAAETLGNTSPTAPKPPKKKGCGMMGMVLIAVIAIAVTAITAGAALAAATPGLSLSGGITAALGGTATLATGAPFTAGLIGTFGVAGGMAIGAGAAAIGSIVSQGVGVATGLQDKFSWKGVAMSALAGGIGAGLGGTDVFKSIGIGSKVAGSPLLGNVARGAVSSAITQGIALATNLQNKFDWAGVAAAGVAAGVGGAVGREIAGKGFDQAATRFLTSGASLIASGATRSLLNGSDFGDNVLAGLPDVIAQTVGGLIQDGVSRAERKRYEGAVEQWDAAKDLEQSQVRTTADNWRRYNELARELHVAEIGIDAAATDFEFQEDLITASDPYADVGLRRDATIRMTQRYAGSEAAAITSHALSLVPIPKEITVWGRGGLTRTGEVKGEFLNWAADFLVGVGRAGEYISNKIDGNPLARFGLLALDIASGPAAFAARTIIMASPAGRQIERGVGMATDWIAGKLTAAGLDPTRVFYATSGAILLGGLALGARKGLELFRVSRARMAHSDRLPEQSHEVPKDARVSKIQAMLAQYPTAIDLRTGRQIRFPSDIGSIVPQADRVSWGAKERGQFISEWYERGYATPKGGWQEYHIHHIRPREYGGTNNFWNLTPVAIETHKEFNKFWKGFDGL